MHARQQIREALVTLITGLTTTGANVYDSRAYELEQTDLPFWVVHTPAEESELSSMGGTHQRTVDCLFTGSVRELTGLASQQKLDLMAEELETALSRSAVTAAIAGVRGWELDSTEFFQIPDDADRLFGYVEMTFSATYFTSDGAPGAFG